MTSCSLDTSSLASSKLCCRGTHLVVFHNVNPSVKITQWHSFQTVAIYRDNIDTRGTLTVKKEKPMVVTELTGKLTKLIINKELLKIN